MIGKSSLSEIQGWFLTHVCGPACSVHRTLCPWSTMAQVIVKLVPRLKGIVWWRLLRGVCLLHGGLGLCDSDGCAVAATGTTNAGSRETGDDEATCDAAHPLKRSSQRHERVRRLTPTAKVTGVGVC